MRKGKRKTGMCVCVRRHWRILEVRPARGRTRRLVMMMRLRRRIARAVARADSKQHAAAVAAYLRGSQLVGRKRRGSRIGGRGLQQS